MYDVARHRDVNCVRSKDEQKQLERTSWKCQSAVPFPLTQSFWLLWFFFTIQLFDGSLFSNQIQYLWKESREHER